MAAQVHSSAMNPLASVRLNGASLASGTLEAALLAAGVTQATLNRVKHADLKVIAGPFYMEDDGTTASATSMPYEVGERREIRNCRLLLQTATCFATAAYDVRVELYA